MLPTSDDAEPPVETGHPDRERTVTGTISATRVSLVLVDQKVAERTTPKVSPVANAQQYVGQNALGRTNATGMP